MFSIFVESHSFRVISRMNRIAICNCVARFKQKIVLLLQFASVHT